MSPCGRRLRHRPDRFVGRGGAGESPQPCVGGQEPLGTVCGIGVPEAGQPGNESLDQVASTRLMSGTNARERRRLGRSPFRYRNVASRPRIGPSPRSENGSPTWSRRSQHPTTQSQRCSGEETADASRPVVGG